MKKVKSLALKEKQGIFYNKVLYGKERVLILCTGRQVGKTHTMLAIMGKLLYNSKVNLKIGFLTFTHSHNRDNIRNFKNMFSIVNNMTEYNLSNGIVKFRNSTIKFLSAQQNEKIRGNSFDYLFIDEACFINSNLYFESIQPTISASLSQPLTDLFSDGIDKVAKIGGKLIIASTPKSRNWFFDKVNQASYNDNYYLMRFRSIDSEGLWSQELLDEYKRTTPERIYKCEYDAEFLEAGNGLFQFNNAKINNEEYNKGNTNKEYFIGIDYGAVNDYTVITIMNRDKYIQELIRFKEKTTLEILDIIREVITKYNNKGRIIAIYSEQNGVGLLISNDLYKEYPSLVTKFNTTNERKNELINQLSVDFEQNNIKFNPNDENLNILQSELDGYVMIEKNNKITYTGTNGHDDCVMSLGICNYAIKQKNVKVDMIGVIAPNYKRRF